MSGTHNLLVISDIHLGEDMNPSATEEMVRDLDLAERHLLDFLRHYTRRRIDGLPWRLVINGDMVDLMTICILPERHPAMRWLAYDADERKHGLNRRMDAACAQMDAIVDRHEQVFRELARFVGAGNRLDIVCGNHDAELHWPVVQEAFRQGVVRAWRAMSESIRPGAPSPAQLGARIEFHPWFYYEPGVVWIEHGHFYDECCSFEYALNPVGASGEALAANVDTASIRYLSNQIPDVSPHGTEDWSFGGYLRLVYDAGLRGATSLAVGYFRVICTLLSEWRTCRRDRTAHQRRDVHLARRSALSKTTALPENTLAAMDELRQAPVVTSLPRLLQAMMLDKLLLWLATVAVVAVLALTLPATWAAATSAGTLMAATLIGRWMARRRNVDPTLSMERLTDQILEQVDARFVVFGHTHKPVAQPLAHGGWYYNTGTWMPSGKPGLLRCFTHVIIRHGSSGPEASLCQWRDGASRAFTPERSVRPLVPECNPARFPKVPAPSCLTDPAATI